MSSYMGRWMRFGGHAGGGAQPLKDVALREAAGVSGFPEHRFGVLGGPLRMLRQAAE